MNDSGAEEEMNPENTRDLELLLDTGASANVIGETLVQRFGLEARSRWIRLPKRNDTGLSGDHGSIETDKRLPGHWRKSSHLIHRDVRSHH